MEIEQAKRAHELIEKRESLLSAYNILNNSTAICTIGFRTSNQGHIDTLLDVSQIDGIKNLILDHIKSLSADNDKFIKMM